MQGESLQQRKEIRSTNFKKESLEPVNFFTNFVDEECLRDPLVLMREIYTASLLTIFIKISSPGLTLDLTKTKQASRVQPQQKFASRWRIGVSTLPSFTDYN